MVLSLIGLRSSAVQQDGYFNTRDIILDTNVHLFKFNYDFV